MLDFHLVIGMVELEDGFTLAYILTFAFLAGTEVYHPVTGIGYTLLDLVYFSCIGASECVGFF